MFTFSKTKSTSQAHIVNNHILNFHTNHKNAECDLKRKMQKNKGKCNSNGNSNQLTVTFFKTRNKNAEDEDLKFHVPLNMSFPPSVFTLRSLATLEL
jgi:hypothetical protein